MDLATWFFFMKSSIKLTNNRKIRTITNFQVQLATKHNLHFYSFAFIFFWKFNCYFNTTWSLAWHIIKENNNPKLILQLTLMHFQLEKTSILLQQNVKACIDQRLVEKKHFQIPAPSRGALVFSDGSFPYLNSIHFKETDFVSWLWFYSELFYVHHSQS